MDADSIWEYNCETIEELQQELQDTAVEARANHNAIVATCDQIVALTTLSRNLQRHSDFLAERKRLIHQKMDELIGLELAAKALAKEGDLNESYDLLGYPPGYWNDPPASSEVGTGSGCLPEANLKKDKE